jgi:Cu+-exporting ATPase
MTVDPANAPGGSAVYRGTTYYFCNPRCRARFVADPPSFLEKKGSDPFSKKGSDPVSYTCPMHPEIMRPGPGACPICGMDLEPTTPMEGEDGSPELRAMTRRLVVCTIHTVPL